MVRLILPLAALALAVALAGCNETMGGAAAGPVAAAPASPAAFRLPPNTACSGEINRYQAIVSADHDTGNVGDRVYANIESELSEAAAACSSGRGGEAHGLVAASKARHGYRA